MRNLFITALLSLLTIGVSAQNFKNELGFISENDAYLATLNDRYYTNGLMVNFRRALDSKNLSANLEKKIIEFSAGQLMYTPFWGSAPNVETHDRPFAGYLYLGTGVSNFYKNEAVLNFKAQVGTTGPHSLAQDSQYFLHKLVGFYNPSGWEYQIKNEVAVNLSANYSRKLYRDAENSFEIRALANAQLGTTFSGLSIAPIIRVGRLNQAFNSAQHQAVIGSSKTKANYNSEFYFYVRPQLNFVAYDATIQGSMFKNNSPVTFDVYPVVFEQQIGINYTKNRFTLDFKAIFKSKEVKSWAKAQNYGSATVYYRFGKL